MMRLVLVSVLLFLVCAASARADAWFHAGEGESVPPAEGDSLADVISSAVMDLDATIADSYTSGQTWTNLVPSGSAYDFYLGAGSGSSTDDPTFTGTAGTAAAHFAHDGGDKFQIAAGNDSFLASLHKTTGGSDFTFAIAFKFKTTTGSQVVFSTQNGATNSASLRIRINGSGVTHNSALFQHGDTGNAIGTSSGIPLVNDTDTLLVVSHSHSGNQTRFWVNGVLSEISHTFNAGTTDAAHDAVISATGSTNFLTSGSLVYAASLFNEYFDNTQEALLRAEYEERHSRSYTDE